MNDITLVLLFFNSDDRGEILKIVLNYYKDFFDKTIVVEVTNKKETYSKEMIDGVQYVYLKRDTNTDFQFNRAELINFAVSVVSTEYVMICDSDILLSKRNINMILNEKLPADIVCPYSKLYNVDKSNITKEIEQRRFGMGGGCVVFNKNIFNDVVSYDERFVGWGGEDDAFHYITRCLGIRSKFLPGSASHIIHKSKPRDEGLYKENLRLLNEYKKFKGKDFCDYVRKNIKNSFRG